MVSVIEEMVQSIVLRSQVQYWRLYMASKILTALYSGSYFLHWVCLFWDINKKDECSAIQSPSIHSWLACCYVILFFQKENIPTLERIDTHKTQEINKTYMIQGDPKTNSQDAQDTPRGIEQ